MVACQMIKKQGVNTPLLLRKDSLSYDSYGIQQYPSGSFFNYASLKLDRAEQNFST